MQRFNGQPLGQRPHLAVLYQDKLGGFVVATALLRGLKEKYPDATLDYFGGERTTELEVSCPYVDARFSLYGRPGSLREVVGFLDERERAAGPYDLAINLDFNPLNAVVATMMAPRYVVGRCFQQDGRSELPLGEAKLEQLQDPHTVWASENLLVEFGDVLRTNFIGEIFCRLAQVETDFHRPDVAVASPPVDVPDVLIATGGTRKAKLWPTAYWRKLIELCDGAGLRVGLLGAAPSVQRLAYGSADGESRLLQETPLIDLRGMMSLPQVAGALKRSRGCVTIDNGIMHLADAVGTPTVAIFGASPWSLWAPRLPSLHLELPTAPCSLCRDNHFLNDDCLRERHVCMESIAPEAVFARLQAVMRPPC